MKERFQKKTYLNLLDIGSGKIAVMVVRLSDNQNPTVVATSCVPAKGIQAGTIWNLDEAAACIGEAIHLAEMKADHEIKSVIVNISSPQMKSLYLYHEIALQKSQAISEVEVQKLVDGIITQHVPAGQEVLHAFPLCYVVDKNQGKTDPRGIFASTLGAQVHLITIPEEQSMNLLKVLDRCYVSVAMKVATPYASALAVLDDTEKDIGSTVIDFGAGTTSYAVFVAGSLMQQGIIQRGSHQMTRDIAQAFGTDLKSAERLKLLNGAAYLSPRDELERLIVPILGDEEGANMQIRRSALIGIILPRIEEILTQLRSELEAETTFTSVAKHFVLTGGGSGLTGLKEKTASFLSGQTQVGRIKQIKNLPTTYDSCTFNVCVGLLMYALKRRQDNVFAQFQSSTMSKSKIGKVIQWIKQNLS